MNEYLYKTLFIIISGFSYYIYRLYKIPNCLIRNDSNNQNKLCLGSIYSGLIGPIKSLYLALKYNGFKSGALVFKELILSRDNPIFIFTILIIFSFLI
jgi:hypothetical protein